MRLQGGRTIALPGRGSTDISEQDFSDPECQSLFLERSIIILPGRPAVRKKAGTGEEPGKKPEESKSEESKEEKAGKASDKKERSAKVSVTEEVDETSEKKPTK